jgi:hypothetical protein
MMAAALARASILTTLSYQAVSLLHLDPLLLFGQLLLKQLLPFIGQL